MWRVDVRYSSSLLVLCLSLSTPLVASEAVSESDGERESIYARGSSGGCTHGERARAFRCIVTVDEMADAGYHDVQVSFGPDRRLRRAHLLQDREAFREEGPRKTERGTAAWRRCYIYRRTHIARTCTTIKTRQREGEKTQGRHARLTRRRLSARAPSRQSRR